MLKHYQKKLIKHLCFLFVCTLSMNLAFIARATQPIAMAFEKRLVGENISGPQEICAVDLDSDGDMDIAVVGYGYVDWLENTGSENFTLHSIPVDGISAPRMSICSGDFNQDGDMDLAVKCISGSAWLENDGSENFTPHAFGSEYWKTAKIRAADLDNDTDLDFLVISDNGGPIRYLNDGSGNFIGGGGLSTGTPHLVSVDAGDVDGDGDVDVVTASVSLNDIVVYYYNPLYNNYYQPVVVDSNLNLPTEVFVVDLDQDGDEDILASAEGADSIVWYRRTDWMNYEKHIITNNFDGAQSVVGVDMDNDGDIDVLGCAKNACDIIWWENDGSENFTEHVIDDNYGGIVDVIAVKMDNDQDIDIVACTYGGSRIDWWEQYRALWQEHFAGGTSGVQPAGWYDETNDSGFNAEIAYSTTDSLVDVNVVSGETWGKVLSFSQMVDLDQYPQLELRISGLTNGTAKIGVFRNSPSWEEHFSDEIVQPGTYRFDIPTLSGGWNGLENLGIEILVIGSSASTTVELVRLCAASILVATPTPTPTPTQTSSPTATQTPIPTPGILWDEAFLYSDDIPASSPGDQPPGWYDESNDNGFNAQISYTANDGLAQISTVLQESWGKVLSFSQDVNLSLYHSVEVVVDSIDNGVLKIAAFSQSSGWEEFVCGTITVPGTYYFNIPDHTGWSGVKNMGIEMITEGENCSVIIDAIRLQGVITPTVTPTITPTGVPTPVWQDVFFYSDDSPISSPGDQPPGWYDDTNDTSFRSQIVYSTNDGLADVAVTSGPYGKVLSYSMDINLNETPIVEVAVNSMNAGYLQIGVFRQTPSWEEYTGSLMIYTPGVYSLDIPAITGWSGTVNMGVFLVVGGESATATYDYIRIINAASGAAVNGAMPVWTPTYTVTPTQTPTQTPQQINTSTPTPTATPTPYVSAATVLPYPNPARGKVNFAYTISGAGKVVIDIYKLTGERVASITEQVNGGTGQTLSTAWDAIDVAPGIYFCRIVITDGSGKEILNQKKKVALIK